MAGVRSRAARAERAEATRVRIVEAAAPLFVEFGYLETTMAALARAAGVAVQTLYLSFGGKAAVLKAALAAAGDDQPIGWLPRLRDEPHGPTALSGYVRATAADPDPAELLAGLRQDALARHARAVDELAEKPGFTHRLSLQRATESLAALVSPEVYGLLVAGQHWTVPDWAEWAVRHAVADLFPDHPVPDQPLPAASPARAEHPRVQPLTR